MNISVCVGCVVGFEMLENGWVGRNGKVVIFGVWERRESGGDGERVEVRCDIKGGV